MQQLSNYRWLALLGIVAALVMLLGLGRPQAARAFTLTTCTVVPCPPNPYFFPGPNPYLFNFASTDPNTGYGPTGIVFANGNIYVADAVDSRLYVYPGGGGGSPSTYPISGCSGPIGLTLSQPSVSGGGLYVACGGGGIKEIKFDGTIVRTVTTAVSGADMATDAFGGDLLVSGNGASRIYRVTVATVPVVTECASGIIQAPDGITFDQQTSTIYVANQNGKVVRIPDIGGVCGPPSILATFPSGTGVDGIAVGRNGTACQDTIYVNANNGNIYPVTISTGVIGSPIATGTERGDLVKVSPDGYLYATQSASVAKIGPPCFVSQPVGPASPVGGIVGLTVSSSGSPVPWTPLAAVAAAALAVVSAGGWYARRRWLR